MRLIICIGTLCLTAWTSEAVGQNQDLWLMKGHDVRRTGQSSVNGPRFVDPARSWTVEIPAAHTINIGASVSADAAFFGSWGLLRRDPDNPDPRLWDKSDGAVYALGLREGAWFWEAPADLDLVPRCYAYEDRGPNLLWCGLTPYEVSFYNGTVEGQAAIDTSRGVVYVGRGDGKLYALDHDTGAVRWRYVTFNPALPDDPDGGGEVVTSPLLTPDGTVYFGTWGEGDYETNAVYAVHPDGTLRWRYPADASLDHRLFASPALSPDGATVYFATFRDDNDSAGRLYALDVATGELRWSYVLTRGGATIHATTLAVGVDGTIYVGGFVVEGFGLPVLLAIADDGSHGWMETFDDGAQLVLGIALREVGGVTRRLYATTANLGTPLFNAKVEGALYAVDPTSGSVLGSYDPSDDVPEAVGGINSPAIGADGAIYFGVRGRYGGNARQGHYFGVDFDVVSGRFERLWSVATDGFVEWSHPAIGPDGGIYAASSSLDEQARTPTYEEGEVPEGTTAWFHAIKGPASSTATELSGSDADFRLHPPYPNPFHERTTAVIDGAGAVVVEVFDMLGRRIRRIDAGSRAVVAWDGLDDAGRAAPHGVYVLHATLGAQHRQAMVVKAR